MNQLDIAQKVAALEWENAQLRALLETAIELTEMSDEFNEVGSDAWVWLMQAKEFLHASEAA